MTSLRNKGNVIRTANGYIGQINIEGVIMDINATFWDGKKYKCDLWIQRIKEKKYDELNNKFIDYTPKPFLQCFANKLKKKDTFDYKGDFIFVGFKYDLIAWWDDKAEHQLNISVERSKSQPILERLNKIKKENETN